MSVQAVAFQTHVRSKSGTEELIAAAAAALREVYELVPGVSLGVTTAEAAEAKLHFLFENC